MSDKTPHSGSESPDWKSRPSASAPRPLAPRTPSWRPLVLLSGIAVLIGLSVFLLLRLRPLPKPRFLALAVTEYAEVYPPQAFATADADLLAGFFLLGANVFESQEQQRFLAEVDGLATHGSSPAVLYIRAYGRPGADGVPCILPAHALPDDATSWIRLDTLLDRLAQSKAPGKLLLLDIMGPLREPRLGLPGATTAEADPIHAYLRQKEKDLDCVIFAAAGAGQTSLVSEDLGHSAFAYYLAQGLRGAADGYNDQKTRNGRVDVAELVRFTEARVSRWAAVGYQHLQRPVVYGLGTQSFELTVTNATPEVDPSSQDEEGTLEYPDSLYRAWKMRDDFLASGASRAAPCAFRRCEALLLRAETAWRGGSRESRVEGILANLRETEQVMRGELAALALPPRRPPTLATRRLKADNADLDALEKLLRTVVPRKPEPGKPATAEPDKPPVDLTAFRETFLKKPPEQLPWTVLTTALTIRPWTAEQLRLLSDLVSPPPGQPDVYRETEVLRRLAALPPDGSAERGRAFRAALQATMHAESFRDRLTPQIFPWLRSYGEKAEASRRSGENALRSAAPGRCGPAADRLEQAVTEYEEALQIQEWVARAHTTLEDGLNRLPGFVPYLGERADLGDGLDRAWDSAVQSCVALNRALTAFAAGGDPRALRGPTEGVRQALADLERPFQRAEVLSRRAAEGEPRDFAEMEALLKSPYLSAKARALLWEAQRELGSMLEAKARFQDRRDDRAKEPTQPETGGRASEPTRVSIRARRLVDLLSLGGYSGADDLKKHSAELGETLRIVLGVRLPTEIKNHLDAGRVKEAEKLLRLVPLPNVPQREPGATQRRNLARELRAWLDDGP